MDKSIDNAKRRNKIAEEIKLLENKIAYVKPIELKAAGFRIGDIVEWGISKNEYIVIKINKKTVTIKNTTSDYKEAVNPNHLKLIKAAPATEPKPAAKSAWIGSKKPAIKTATPTDKAKVTGKAFTAAGKPKPTAKPEAKPTTQPTSKPAKPRAKSEPKPEVIEKRLEGKIETRKRRARVAITEAHNLSVELEKLQRRKKIVNI
jgi:outer membrane biosynthesis protein TonB